MDIRNFYRSLPPNKRRQFVYGPVAFEVRAIRRRPLFGRGDCVAYAVFLDRTIREVNERRPRRAAVPLYGSALRLSARWCAARSPKRRHRLRHMTPASSSTRCSPVGPFG